MTLSVEHVAEEISRQLADLSADAVEPGILEALSRLATATSADRAAVCRFARDGAPHDPLAWAAPGILPVAAVSAGGAALPWTLARVLTGHEVVFASLADLPGETDRRTFDQFEVRSGVIVPLPLGDRIGGALELSTIEAHRQWHDGLVASLARAGRAMAEALERRERGQAAHAAMSQLARLNAQLQSEISGVSAVLEWSHPSAGTIAARSPVIRQVMEQVRQVAQTDSTVLLLGETGTGKEVFASQIHDLSRRRARPMVRVNCAAIPGTLIESELFGREKGAFTDALSRQVGRFELAHQSTILLDEIGDLPAEVQVKLLRVLEERTIERLGSPRSIPVDVRIIAATHQDLQQRITAGKFRDDLYYRLNVFPIHIPPLRERVEDIPLLVWAFVEEFSQALGKRIEAVTQESMALLLKYPWPGNIRELRNAVERAVISARGPRLTIPVPHATTSLPGRSTKLADVERDHIRAVLESTGWRVRGPGGAAERLGLKPTTIETRMAKLGIKRPGRT